MEKYDTSQLTEFPRFESEATQSGVSSFFNKLLKPLFTPSEGDGNDQNGGPEVNKQEDQSTEEQSKKECDDAKSVVGTYAQESEGRSLPYVLRRITSLIASGSGGGTKYSETELFRYWMPDDISRECYECAARFSTLRRRHHCRVCGQIFCSRCCSQRVPGHIFGCAGGLRVCNYCCNVVLSYLNENVDLNGEVSPDLRSLQENLQVKFPDNKEQASKSRDNFMFGRDHDEPSDARSSSKDTLQDVFQQLAHTLPTHQHRYRLVRYNGVWRGADILQWIMDNTNNKTRVQATGACQSLLSAGYVECVCELPHFADYALYRPIPATKEDHVDEDHMEESGRLVGSVSSYCLDLNLGESSARLIKTPKAEKKSPSSDEESVVDQPNVEGHTETRPECKAISAWGEEHLRLLMRQWLARLSLSAVWLDALYPLCVQAADIIVPESGSNDIDVRNYVQVKKVPGGSPRDSCLVRGVVLTKNVAHRGMPLQISNPSILLLDGSIAYQRVEGKLTSLEPVLMQEQAYLRHCADRIKSLRARVVLVGGTAGRAVQTQLVSVGAALALRVRPRALRRAARATSGDLLASIDARIGMPRLGAADNFRVTTYGSKTLMILEGCAQPQLACCILLRGGSLQELVRLKKIVKFMLLACYNWKLEKSFLADIEAVLPEPGMDFDDIGDNTDDSKGIFDIDDNTVDTKRDLDNSSCKSDKNDSQSRNIDKLSVNDKIDKINSENLNTKDDLTTEEEKDLNKVHENYTKVQNTSKDVKNNITNVKIDDVNESDTERRHTDPLQRPKSYTRKAESRCGVPIKDFSDPLRATLSVDDDVFLPEEDVLKADAQNERWCADDVILSMSPTVLIPAPYLETEAGRRCPLRAHFPAPLLRRAAASTPQPATPRALRKQTPMSPVLPTATQEYHPFVKMVIRGPCEEATQRAALAHFRATGGHRANHATSCPKYNPSVVRPSSVPATEERAPEQEHDPLVPSHHQRLHVLLYSYSSKSPNVPDFCVNPWVVTMEMYGRHDISLGAFLDKYCFNSELKCSPTVCHVPMNQHVRRFVHGDVCITITCNTVGHSSVDKVKEDTSKQVMFWWRCCECSWTGRGVRVRPASLRLSLAQYLRSRVSSARQPRPAAPCRHATAAHAFQRHLTTACFRFSKISTYDVVLPPAVISTQHDTKQMRDALIAQLNDIMLKGHETFSTVSSGNGSGNGSGEADKEYQAFKHHMEQIHVALTAPSLHDSSVDAVVRSLWSISDGIIFGEKMLRDAQETWSSPPPPALAKAKQLPDTSVEDKPESDESSSEPTGNDNAGTTYVFASDNPTKDIEKDTGLEEDEEKGDKKTIRQILSQLLSSNQAANQTGMILCGGLVPVVMQATQTGSVIAAALASPSYRRARPHHKHSNHTDQEESDANASKEKPDGEKTKAAKSNEHVEVLLKDGLVCRVYYAAQFQALRHAVIAPLAKEAECCCDQDKKLCSIEEGFIRSLAHCVPWATRGGKSGSTFCKTKDDRYVLKEMTKPEWLQFLEFAPHYFAYVNSCRQSKLPSLLARILGVFSVGGAGDGVLVLEHVWYGCDNHERFDLKGSSRHRLAPPDPATTQPVLMDENLLNLRWERPLYVRGHAARVLWASLDRDTEFLAAHGVMDYSLLLARGEHDLVLGLIDYIRTFTWDKKLEHLVKKNLGPGLPTVVSPAQYKRRFNDAARKYFLQCPEPWDHFYDVLQ